MATDPTSPPQTFAPLVTQLTDALSRQLADAFAGLQAGADRERDEAVSAVVARDADVHGRELAAQRAALDAQVASLRDDYDARLAAQAAQAREEHDALEARLRIELTTALDAVHRDADLRIVDAQAKGVEDGRRLVTQADETAAHTRIVERELAMAAAARLLSAFERIDAAHTLRETLDGLVESLAAEVARVLVFVTRGDGLRGWQFIGVAGAPAEAAGVAIGRAQSGPLDQALAGGAAIEVHPSALADAVPALGWLRTQDGDDAPVGIAVPLVVDQQAVAVVYCDDGVARDRGVPAAWPEVVQVLVRHASRCLEAHTARRAAGYWRPAAVSLGADVPDLAVATRAVPSAADIEGARRFARLVVSELKLYNEPAVVAGRDARDLRVRLGDALARARRMYEARVPATLPGRDDYFDQEVVRTLADGDPALLGDVATSVA